MKPGEAVDVLHRMATTWFAGPDRAALEEAAAVLGRVVSAARLAVADPDTYLEPLRRTLGVEPASGRCPECLEADRTPVSEFTNPDDDWKHDDRKTGNTDTGKRGP